MNEVRALVEAFDAANIRGERCALATVVSVEGSSYRRPGARMLVCEAGTTTGTISAGCLESDIIEHAKRVIRTGAAKLVEYDTTSTSDEEAWGLGLGCNGIVRVFVEPLASGSPYIEALRRSCAPGAASVSVATVYAPSQVFFETLLPPVPLVIFGAGHDALPVVELARNMGWQTEVVDPQARPASRSRFAIADRVTLSRPEDVGRHVSITPRTMTLLMSHNYSHDLAMLRFLLSSPARYIGVMGPRKRTERMLRELPATEGIARLHSPAGLDIGANGPSEVALSIVAEMRAVLDRRQGGMLRERRGSIHGSPGDGERVGAVILAAGSSSRMGSPKQILQFQGKSLLRHAALAALGAGCSPVIVVTGAYAELSRRELEGLDVREMLNPHWETGMASSIGAGLEGLLGADPDAAAAVLMLCDQPHITAGVISGLAAAHRVTGKPVIASTYGGSFGVPALFGRSLFAELARLEGGAGAKQVIKRYASEAHFLPFRGGEVDVDTRDDFARLPA
ncbi:MAG: xanthine dehydrogenase accessory factor [Acidobacteriota bacterium]|jgi:xanthine/CO dehydrogenase XdhC/CoxF family maturation factor/molybdopterin-guanine dinucleotide biosynthesis protein A|nr:xanthine dehydrogenase accessory factor [Acidobacteriota bacterium]